MKLAEKVKEFFHNEGIHSTTIQPEFVEVEVCIFNISSCNNTLCYFITNYYTFIQFNR